MKLPAAGAEGAPAQPSARLLPVDFEEGRGIFASNRGLKYPAGMYSAVVSPDRQFIPWSVLGLHPSHLRQHLSPPGGDCSRLLLPISPQTHAMSSRTHRFFLYLALEGTQRKPSLPPCSPGSAGCPPHLEQRTDPIMGPSRRFTLCLHPHRFVSGFWPCLCRSNRSEFCL